MATSLEKLQQLKTDLAGTPPAEGMEAVLQTMMGQALPIIEVMLPDDPHELDEQLTRCGEFILALRSDPVEPLLPYGTATPGESPA